MYMLRYLLCKVNGRLVLKKTKTNKHQWDYMVKKFLKFKYCKVLVTPYSF